MTHEERAAMIQAQTAMMLCEMEGMIAENQHRLSCGESVAYGEDAFLLLRNSYEPTLGINALIAFMRD